MTMDQFHSPTQECSIAYKAPEYRNVLYSILKYLGFSTTIKHYTKSFSVVFGAL